MHTMAKEIEETEIVAAKGNHSLEFVDGVTKKSVALYWWWRRQDIGRRGCPDQRQH